ncbi:hypothetical protein GCM10027053_13530 [Intrasporangium mesophilum]
MQRTRGGGRATWSEPPPRRWRSGIHITVFWDRRIARATLWCLFGSWIRPPSLAVKSTQVGNARQGTSRTTRTTMGSVIKKRRKRMAKKKHRKLLRKTRHQRRNKK